MTPALLEGQFLKRYKRFFADFLLEGELQVAHVANTGSMKSCLQAGAPCLVSPASNPERKLRWSLEALQINGTWVGVNTARPNQLVAEAFQQKTIAEYTDFTQMQSEVKINAQSRIDFLLTSAKRRRYVEVKNVTLAEGQVAFFPDAVTERGQKHLQELMQLTEQGHEAEILFVVQRSDCRIFSAADFIDPEYAKLLKMAKEKGVRVSAYAVDISPEELKLTNRALQVHL